MLGSDLAERLQRSGCAVRVWDLPDWDITRPDDLERALAGAAVAVNCAAFTDVDQAEERPAVALAVNAAAVGGLGRLAARQGVFVVHVSTDYVFDGRSDQPYRETDAPAPINAYGRSKWQGELALGESGCEHAILRLEWSYGRRGTHFIAKLLESARRGGELKVVRDQFGAPTWTMDAARAVECLVRDHRRGVYHFANAGYASRYEVARFVAERLKLAVRIVPCASDDFPVRARRPANSRFDTAKIRAALDHPIRPWQEALAEFLEGQ